MKPWILFLPLLAIVCIGCTDSSRPDAVATVSPAPDTAPVAKAMRAGRDIYLTSCAECHGKNGEGAEKGISLIKGHALYHTADDFIDRVTNGKADEMPAFRDKLTEAEIAEVVRFVREDIQGPYLKKSSKDSK